MKVEICSQVLAVLRTGAGASFGSHGRMTVRFQCCTAMANGSNGHTVARGSPKL
jgi:hypothetical protein